MIGGKQEVFAHVKPFFEAMGKVLYYCGKSGMGLRAKLTQNLILGNLLQAFNEGLVLSTKAGVDPELMLDILNNSAARSGLISVKAPMVFKRDFSTNFSVKWLEKDIGLALDLGSEIGVPLLLTGLTQQLFQTAMAKGYGEEDICGSIRVLEELAGVKSAPRRASADREQGGAPYLPTFFVGRCGRRGKWLERAFFPHLAFSSARGSAWQTGELFSSRRRG